MTTLSIILSIVNLLLLAFFSFYYVKNLNVRMERKKRIKILETKNEIISSINREESTSEIANTLMISTLDLFDFDYVIISMVDHLRNTISTEYSRTKNKKLIDPQKWERERYNLSDKNILCEVVRKKGIIKVLGQNLDQNIRMILNSSIFTKYNHVNLNRVFIPIIHRSSKMDTYTTADDIVLGIVEVGFHNNTRKDIPQELIAEYNLFLLSCEQNIYRAYGIREKELILQLTSSSYKIDNHHTYLKLILSEMVNLLDADFGAISLLHYDEEKIKYGVITNFPLKEDVKTDSFLPFTIDMNSLPKGIVGHAISSNNYYFNNDVKNDKNYTSVTETSNSELAVPIRYQDVVIGALNFESAKKLFFNKNKATLIQEIIDRITPIYIKKKLNTVLKDLVIPFENITNISSIYTQTIRLIEEYFICDLVYISKKKNDFEANYSFEGGLEKLKDLINIDVILNSELIKEARYPTLLSEDYVDVLDENNSHKRYFKGSIIKSMVVSPLNFNNNHHGFIIILTQRKLYPLFPEDIIFLTEISRKVALTIQYSKLVNSFYNISSLINKQKHRTTLQVITDEAKEVLLADSVHMYSFDSQIEKTYYELIISGKLLHPELKKIVNQQEPMDTYLIDYIIRNDSVLFENHKDYEAFNINRPKYHSRQFNKSFWYREGIKSMMGICLKYNNEPIGVMFFNYRIEQRFDDKTKRLVEAFASYASINAINARNFELIRDQAKRLEEKYDKIKFEYEDVYNKMREMIPLATRTSFYLILRGINHDIRNLLLSLKQSSIRISRSSNRLERSLRISIENNIHDISRNIKVVTNLLELFNFTTFEEEYIDTFKVINDVVYFFKMRDESNIIFDNHELDSSLNHLKCVKSEFSMIIYNLISNSLKAISNANRKNGLIELRSSLSNNNYIISIKDNGTGIDKDIKPRIYEPGFSSIKGGLGIGLYFIKEVLESSFNGSISCNSKYGVFTEFNITIPYS